MGTKIIYTGSVMELDSTELLLSEREQRYGDFRGHARITQDLKNTMRSNSKWHELTDEQRESLEMIAHKIARILNGDPNYKDSWEDICGYAKLIVKQLD